MRVGMSRRSRASPSASRNSIKADCARRRSPEDAVLNSDASIVIVPTPSNVLGGFSLKYVLRVCEQIGAALRRKKDEHTSFHRQHRTARRQRTLDHSGA